MFLQKTEKHYRLALTLENKASPDTEVTAKDKAAGGEYGKYTSRITDCFLSSLLAVERIQNKPTDSWEDVMSKQASSLLCDTRSVQVKRIKRACLSLRLLQEGT